LRVCSCFCGFPQEALASFSLTLLQKPPAPLRANFFTLNQIGVYQTCTKILFRYVQTFVSLSRIADGTASLTY
jgi:hypothetical protein